VCDGIVSVDAHGHQHVGGRVCDADLREADGLAGQVACPPRNRDAPYDVGEDVEQSHAQIWK